MREDEITGERELKLISVCKIDNLHTDVYKADSPHYFKEPYILEDRNVTERLIRMNQNYKTAMQHALNLGEYNKEEEFKLYMLEQIMKVNYDQQWGHIDSYFSISISFTWMDWLITEQALKDENFDTQEVSDEMKLQIVHNIFPDGMGILHMLALKKGIN